MLMQNFGVTKKEHYGMLWYFWSGQLGASSLCLLFRVSGWALSVTPGVVLGRQPNNSYSNLIPIKLPLSVSLFPVSCLSFI